MTQEQVASRLGTLREVYERWERDERKPVVSVWPSILAFLGYDPDRDAAANLTLASRRAEGLDQKRSSAQIGVIHQKLRDWEHDRDQPTEEQILRMKEIAHAVANDVSAASKGA